MFDSAQKNYFKSEDEEFTVVLAEGSITTTPDISKLSVDVASSEGVEVASVVPFLTNEGVLDIKSLKSRTRPSIIELKLATGDAVFSSVASWLDRASHEVTQTKRMPLKINIVSASEKAFLKWSGFARNFSSIRY